MRIIGGKYRGRHIPVPQKFRARPTTDFAREGLFNILSNTWEFEDLRVLDLYAGTGSIGFEFASRGAGQVEMVESDPKISRFLQQTAGKLSAGNVRVFLSDALHFIDQHRGKYDIVFADPPYDLDSIPELPDRVFAAALLFEEGWFILEHGKKNDFRSHPRLRNVRKYGSVHFSFFA